jgi:hypothetical protein
MAKDKAYYYYPISASTILCMYITRLQRQEENAILNAKILFNWNSIYYIFI